MSFTVTDFSDFKELLGLHPEWQGELRRMIVGQDLETLPSLVHDLVESQRGAEQRLTRLEEAVARLEAAVERLTEAVLLGDKRMARIEDRLGKMDGQLLEMRYRDRAGAYFGRWLRRTRVVDLSDLADELKGHLSRAELDDAIRIDLVIRGQPDERPELGEIWLAIELSVVVDRDDVSRAISRADLIRRGGRKVLPVVAGEFFTEGAEFIAADRKVLLLKNGAGEHWEDAIQRWIK